MTVANDEWLPVNQTGLTGLSSLGAMLWVLSQATTEAKTVPEFKNSLQLIWFALLEKAIDNSVKDNRKWLQACVWVNGAQFEHIL